MYTVMGKVWPLKLRKIEKKNMKLNKCNKN